MCNCKYGNETVLTTPKHLIDAGVRKNQTTAIDPCIAQVLQKLWNLGWITLGCCCGHNLENPSLIVAEGYDEEQIDRLKITLEKLDKRTWNIRQWRLVEL